MQNRDILIFSDCDGTITKVPGKALLFGDNYKDFYSELTLKNGKDNAHSTLLPLNDIVKKMKKEYIGEGKKEKTPYDPRRITPEAVTFYKEMLKNPNAEIVIVSRNQANYIKALFLIEGFSKEQVERIKIHGNAYKYDVAQAYMEKRKGDLPKAIYVFDDDQMDGLAMQSGIAKALKIPEAEKNKHIQFFHLEKPGQFDWLKQLKDILSFKKPISVKPVITSTEKIDNNLSVKSNPIRTQATDFKKVSPNKDKNKRNLIFGQYKMNYRDIEQNMKSLSCYFDVDKDEAFKMLSKQPDNSYLIRYSENAKKRNGHGFVVSHRKGNEVWHHLPTAENLRNLNNYLEKLGVTQPIASAGYASEKPKEEVGQEKETIPPRRRF